MTNGGGTGRLIGILRRVSPRTWMRRLVQRMRGTAHTRTPESIVRDFIEELRGLSSRERGLRLAQEAQKALQHAADQAAAQGVTPVVSRADDGRVVVLDGPSVFGAFVGGVWRSDAVPDIDDLKDNFSPVTDPKEVEKFVTAARKAASSEPVRPLSGERAGRIAEVLQRSLQAGADKARDEETK